ncbi:MAG: hypothetical protein AB1306_04510, partial [Nitrospirota bacterium]
VFLLCAFLFAVSACAANRSHNMQGASGETMDATTESVMVDSSGSYEDCFKVKRGEVLNYKFNSSSPLDFNVHYHRSSEVLYPVLQNNINEHEGTIDPEKHGLEEEYYCLMWKNPGLQQCRISYECNVIQK